MKFMITASPFGYLCIVAKGRLDLDSAKKMIASTARKAEKEEIFALLFDFRDTLIDLRLSEINYLFDHMLNVGLLTLSKFCFVYSQEEADYLHAVNAGYNRGFKIRCFKRPEKAIAWLIERPKLIALKHNKLPGNMLTARPLRSSADKTYVPHPTTTYKL